MKKNNIALIGVCSSAGGKVIGSENAPQSIRNQNLISKLEDVGYKCKDFGDINISKKYNNKQNNRLKNNEIVCRIESELFFKTKNMLNNSFFPLILGGDHSINTGSIIATLNSYQNLGVIWVDAHADFNDEFITNTGNMHGMPLSAVCGLGPNEMINFISVKEFIKCENVVLIGGRDYEEKEKEKLIKNNIRFYEMKDIKKRKIENVIKESLNYLCSKTENIYLSFDVDSIDPKIVPGTGTPVNDGLSLKEIDIIIRNIAKTNKVVAFDLVELNPILDKTGKSTSIATSIIVNFFKYLK